MNKIKDCSKTNVFWHTFDKVLDSLNNISKAVLLFVTIMVTIDVILRYCFNKPLNFVVPISELAMIIMVSFSSVWLQREKKHITIDILFVKLNEKNKNILRLFNSFVGAVVFLITAIYSVPVVVNFITSDVRMIYVSTVIPSYLYLIPLSVCYFGFSIQYFRSTFHHLNSFKDDSLN